MVWMVFTKCYCAADGGQSRLEMFLMFYQSMVTIGVFFNLACSQLETGKLSPLVSKNVKTLLNACILQVVASLPTEAC